MPGLHSQLSSDDLSALTSHMRTRRLPPDNRPDWRDPNMPVYVSTRSQGMVQWDPARLQRAMAAKIALSDEPDWRDDPTYNLKKDRRK